MTRHAAALVLFAMLGACGSRGPDRGGETVDSAAVWVTDDDANIAYPACPRCGADVDRNVRSCDGCGERVRVEAKTIDCPECSGSKTCTHCGPAHACIACDGTHACPICEGTGSLRGAVCPECDADKSCGACASGAAHEVCERCDDTSVCANCEGRGALVLR